MQEPSTILFTVHVNLKISTYLELKPPVKMWRGLNLLLVNTVPFYNLKTTQMACSYRATSEHAVAVSVISVACSIINASQSAPPCACASPICFEELKSA